MSKTVRTGEVAKARRTNAGDNKRCTKVLKELRVFACHGLYNNLKVDSPFSGLEGEPSQACRKQVNKAKEAKVRLETRKGSEISIPGNVIPRLGESEGQRRRVFFKVSGERLLSKAEGVEIVSKMQE